LHIITRLDRGGSAQNTLDTCLHLDYRRYAVYLVHGPSHESGMTATEESQVQAQTDLARARGVRVMTVPSLVRRIDPLADMRAFWALRRIIRSIRPTIVHTHTSKAGFLGRLAAWTAGAPIIVQTPHGHVFYGHFGRLHSRCFLLLEKMAGIVTDRLVALTEQEGRDYRRYAVVPAEKLTTIHSGVDLSRFMSGNAQPLPQRSDCGLPESGPLIGFIGWLLPIKGPLHLLEAMPKICSRVPRARLMFVGKGDLETTLKRRTRELGLQSNVAFLGWRDDIHRIMPLLDVFVLPSLNEGMGRVLVEAMAAGRPVVASRTGGIPDLIEDGVNGCLVPPGNADALADAVLGLIQHPESAREMGRRGEARSREFDLPAMVEKIEGLYVDLIARVRLRRHLQAI
jgi:glycosyltransferase involved in cell wall biosynthesis